MKSGFAKTLLGIFASFGPIIVFYAFDYALGLKAGIIASSIFSIGEVAYRLWRKQPINTLFKVTAISTVGLGILDICLASPRFFSFEATITNAAFGFWFLWMMVKGPGPLLEELVRLRPDLKETQGPRGMVALEGKIRVALFIFVVQHALTAVLYAWVGWHYTIEEAVGVRVLVGNVSLIPVVLALRFALPPMYAFAVRRRWLPDPLAVPDARSSVSEQVARQGNG